MSWRLLWQGVRGACSGLSSNPHRRLLYCNGSEEIVLFLPPNTATRVAVAVFGYYVARDCDVRHLVGYVCGVWHFVVASVQTDLCLRMICLPGQSKILRLHADVMD